MNLNYIFFPAPKCSYTPEQLRGELIWIPVYKDQINSIHNNQYNNHHNYHYHHHQYHIHHHYLNPQQGYTNYNDLNLKLKNPCDAYNTTLDKNSNTNNAKNSKSMMTNNHIQYEIDDNMINKDNECMNIDNVKYINPNLKPLHPMLNYHQQDTSKQPIKKSNNQSLTDLDRITQLDCSNTTTIIHPNNHPYTHAMDNKTLIDSLNLISPRNDLDLVSDKNPINVTKAFAFTFDDAKDSETWGSRIGPPEHKAGGFGGKTGPFEGRIALFEGRTGTFEGRKAPFEGKTRPFVGKTGPLEGKIGPFEDGKSPFENRASAFEGGKSSQRVGISPEISLTPSDIMNQIEHANKLNTIGIQSEKASETLRLILKQNKQQEIDQGKERRTSLGMREDERPSQKGPLLSHLPFCEFKDEITNDLKHHDPSHDLNHDNTLEPKHDLPHDLNCHTITHNLKSSLTHDTKSSFPHDAKPSLLHDFKPSLPNDTKPSFLHDSKLNLLRDTKHNLPHDSKPSFPHDTKPRPLQDPNPSHFHFHDTKPNLLHDPNPTLFHDTNPSLLHDSKPILDHDPRPKPLLHHVSKPPDTAISSTMDKSLFDNIRATIQDQDDSNESINQPRCFPIRKCDYIHISIPFNNGMSFTPLYENYTISTNHIKTKSSSVLSSPVNIINTSPVKSTQLNGKTMPMKSSPQENKVNVQVKSPSSGCTKPFPPFTKKFSNPISKSPKKPTKDQYIQLVSMNNTSISDTHNNNNNNNESILPIKSISSSSCSRQSQDTSTIIISDIIEFYIPCLWLKASIDTNKVLVYFHGNGEDIRLAYELLDHIKNNLMINILGVEYPGYGLYKGNTSDAKILEDSLYVYDYLTQKLLIDPQNLIIFGRSIGTGPATWLASQRRVGALILMSAFTSLRGVVKDLAGTLTQYLIKERFNNLEWIKKVTAPVLLVHGLKDRLISFRHSMMLKKACKSKCEIVIPRFMDHTEFDFFEDFTFPLGAFLDNIGMRLFEEENLIFTIPRELFQQPKFIPERK